MPALIDGDPRPMLHRTLGAEIRRHRHAQHLRLIDVAATAHISPGYLSEIELGTKEPSSVILGAICTALGVTIHVSLVTA